MSCGVPSLKLCHVKVNESCCCPPRTGRQQVLSVGLLWSLIRGDNPLGAGPDPSGPPVQVGHSCSSTVDLSLSRCLLVKAQQTFLMFDKIKTFETQRSCETQTEELVVSLRPSTEPGSEFDFGPQILSGVCLCATCLSANDWPVVVFFLIGVQRQRDFVHNFSKTLQFLEREKSHRC